MKKSNKIRNAIIFVFITTVAVAFYWYEWRPSQIRKECAEPEYSGFGGTEYAELRYERCLNQHGL